MPTLKTIAARSAPGHYSNRPDAPRSDTQRGRARRRRRQIARASRRANR